MKVKLKSLCQNNEQQAKFCNDDIVEYIDVSSVNHSLKKIEKYTRYRFADAPSRARKLVRYGDVLVSTVRPNLNAVAICDERLNYPIVASTAFAILRARADVNPRFLYYCCLSNPFIQELCMQSTGANYPAVSESAVRNVYVNYYSRLEQDKLVSSLDQLGKCICALQGILQRLDSLIKARFVEMFGDLVENPRNWRVEELGDYIVFMTSGPRGWSKYFSDAGEYFLTIRNVKGCNVFTENIQHVRCPNNAEADRAKVKEGDLLISITADLGRTGVVSEQIANHGTYINQHLMCVRLMKEMLHPVYVAHLLESEGGRLQFSQKNQSAVKAGLNYESIRTLKIMVPPMHLQLAFVAFITQVDKSKVVVQKALDKAQQLYDSLMQQYFD